MLDHLRCTPPSRRDATIFVCFLSALTAWSLIVWPVVTSASAAYLGWLSGGWIELALEWAGYGYLMLHNKPSPAVCIVVCVFGLARPISWWAWAITAWPEWQLLLLIVPAAYLCAYLTNALFFFSMEHFLFPERMRRCKIQPQITIGHRETWGILLNVMVSLVIGGPLAMALVYVGSTVKRGVVINAMIPPGLSMLGEMAFLVYAEEFVFYYTHVWMHKIPFVYKHLHKEHHRLTAPIALGSIYGHWIEHIIQDWLPSLFGGMLLGAHVYTLVFYLFLTAMATQNDHSGFLMPWEMEDTNYHDVHHEKFTVNYGGIGLLDGLHGTDHYDLGVKNSIAQEVFPIWLGQGHKEKH